MFEKYELENLAKKMALAQGKDWDTLTEDERESYRILAKVADTYADDADYGSSDYFSCGC